MLAKELNREFRNHHASLEDSMPAELSIAPVEPVVEPVAAPVLSPGQKAIATQAESVPVETTEPPALSAKAQRLVELGFENVANDDEAFDRLAAAYTQTKTEFGQQLQAALAELRQSAPQPTVTPTTQDARTGKWTWEPPAVDPALLAAYRTADGWKPETPPEIRQAAEARQRYFDSFATKFVSDPASALDPLLEDRFEQLWNRKYGQVAQQQQLQTVQQKVLTENPWLFESDPISGRPSHSLSADGKLIDQYMQEAQSRGADYELSWEYAVSKHRAGKAEFAAKQAEQAKAASDKAEQGRQSLLNRAGGTPNRTGSLPTPSDSRTTQRNRNLTPGQRAVQNMARNGVAVN
jgi:hypothetical protein